MNKDIEEIFINKNIISIQKICDEFYEFTKKNFIPYNINLKETHEIELILLNPTINIFTNLYNYNVSNKNSYIEVKNIINKQLKTRLRKNINEFDLYINNKNNILDLFKNETWNLKKNIVKEENINHIFTYSKESKVSFNSNQIVKLQYYFINSIQLRNNYFKAEIRLRTLLNTSQESDNNLLLSYFNKNNTKRILDIEIEVNPRIDKLDKKEFKSQFIKILQYTYGISNPNFYFCYDQLFSNLKTNMINILDLLKMDYKNCLITKKVDGEHVQFYIKNSICYIVKFNIILELNCNILKEYEVSGAGELVYIKKNRYLIPFHIEKIVKNKKIINFKTKVEYLDLLKKIIVDTSTLNNVKKKSTIQLNEKLDLIIIKKKFYGPYENKKEFLDNFLTCYNKIEFYPVDGIIITKNNEINIESILDYKFKSNNTIDLYTNLNIYKPKQNNLMRFDLSFIGIQKNKKEKQIHDLYSINIAISDNLYYDYNLSMIIYKLDDLKMVLPLIFISEYFIDENTFKPRMDKTNKLYQKNKYYGNGLDVILKCRVIQLYKLYYDIDVLRNIFKQDNLNEFIESLEKKINEYMSIETKNIFNLNKTDIETELETELEVEEKIENKNFLIEPLNLNKSWYKPNNNFEKRSALNILTNLNKTYGLLFGIGNMVNTQSYKSILSIYCGKGGDLGKFVHNDISEVVGIDPNPEVLKIFNERRKTILKERVKIFKLTTIPLHLEEIDFLDKIHKKIGINKTFDVIDIQLGIHFSLNKITENHIMKIFAAFVNKNKEPKTRVLISTNDKDNILKLHEIYNTNLGDPLNIKFDNNFFYQITYKNDKNEKIEIFYPPSMNEPNEEYLISKDYLINLFEKHNYSLINTWSFDEIIQEKEIYNQLYQYYKRNSTKNFLMNIKNIDLKNENLINLIKIFRYYIFEYNSK